MAKDIYIDTGELSSRLLNKTKDYIDTAQARIKKVGDSPSYRGPDGYAALYSFSMMSELSSIQRKLNSLESKLEQYGELLNSGPDALVEIDRNQRNQVTTWRERTTYRYETSWLGETAQVVATGITETVDSTIDAFEYGVSAVVTEVTDVISEIKTSYEEHGTVYKAVEYGKCAVSAVKGVIKIVKGAVSVATGVGAPIGMMDIISGIDSLCNAAGDATYISCEAYELVGTSNWLHDLLIENGTELGVILGNEEAGKTFGEAVYTTFKAVDLLNDADELLKNFGVLNADLTGTTGYSFCWGNISWDDVLDSSLKETLYDIGKGTYNILKDSVEFGEQLVTLSN